MSPVSFQVGLLISGTPPTASPCSRQQSGHWRLASRHHPKYWSHYSGAPSGSLSTAVGWDDERWSVLLGLLGRSDKDKSMIIEAPKMGNGNGCLNCGIRSPFTTLTTSTHYMPCNTFVSSPHSIQYPYTCFVHWTDSLTGFANEHVLLPFVAPRLLATVGTESMLLAPARMRT